MVARDPPRRDTAARQVRWCWFRSWDFTVSRAAPLTRDLLTGPESLASRQSRNAIGAWPPISE